MDPHAGNTQAKKRTKKQKTDENAAFIEKLRNTPNDKLSKAARYWLQNVNKWDGITYDMRAVLK